MNTGKEFSFNYAVNHAPTMEMRELIIATALAMEMSKPTSQKRSRPARVPKNPGKSRK